MANTSDDFFASKPFPSAPPIGGNESPAPVLPASKQKSVLTTYVLPVTLFVAVIGGIAWLSQNLSGKRPTETVQPSKGNNSEAPSPLKFDRVKAVWEETKLNEKGEPLDPYVLEWEKGETGFYDFPFHNSSDQPIELGFQRPSCDCTAMKVVLLDAQQAETVKKAVADNPFAMKLASDELAWAEMKVDEKSGIMVPSNGDGILRMTWNGRKEPGSRLRLSVYMWAEPRGKPSQRTQFNLEVPIIVSPPAVLLTDAENIGLLAPQGSAEANFFVWSPTREEFKLKVEHPDPLAEVTMKARSAEECKKIEEDFRKRNRPTRVKSAYDVKIVIHEEKGDKKMEIGPFRKSVALLVVDTAAEIAPSVAGIVRGEAEVGTSEDRGRINLKSFRAASGITVKVPVWTDKKAPLSIESVSPSLIEAKLIKPKDETASRPRWTLEVTVPPEKWTGSFGEDAVLYLKLDTTPPRRVRVPISGTATLR
ncbi:MAG: hypothetical protein K2X38_12220 [Gemmataceae bacterium]|nr:hypothetical protein [Gemmataceae bacterium]